MNYLLTASRVSQVASSEVGRRAEEVVSGLAESAKALVTGAGISSLVWVILALYFGLKVGKKVLSAVFTVIALVCICVYFFGEEPVRQVLSMLV